MVAELEHEGFRVIGADQLLETEIAREGPLGAIQPNAQSEADIEHGLRIARALGALDIGQAVIVQQGPRARRRSDRGDRRTAEAMRRVTA